MKVLHLIDAMGLGGAQTILKSVFEFQKDNKDIYIYALRTKGISMEVDHENLIINESTAKYSFAPLSFLKDFIAKNKIEVLHCHLFRSEVFGYLLKKRHFPDIKLIFHEHGQIVKSDTNRATEDLLYNRFNQFSQSSVDLFIAVSDAMKRFLISNGNVKEDRIKTIYNFVDLEKFDPSNIPADNSAFKQKHGIEAEDFVVGFAGRLIKRKGWKEYLQAAKILSEKRKDIKFLIAGDGNDKPALLEMIKELNIGEQVKYLGYVDNMLAFYGSLDLFAMPSHFEGLPMSQLEVMALGVPLVTTNGPGMDEVPRDGKEAIFVKLYDPQDLADKIDRLYLDQDKAAELADNGLVRVQEFGLKSYVQQLDETYQNLFAQSLS